MRKISVIRLKIRLNSCYPTRFIIKYKNATSSNVAIAKTTKNFLVSLASFTLFDVPDAFGEVAGLVLGLAVGVDAFFLLIILV
jgi:hypothetical protein